MQKLGKRLLQKKDKYYMIKNVRLSAIACTYLTFKKMFTNDSNKQ